MDKHYKELDSLMSNFDSNYKIVNNTAGNDIKIFSNIFYSQQIKNILQYCDENNLCFFMNNNDIKTVSITIY